MKKQSVLVVTLFSLILVLSIYYITLPTEFTPREDIKTTISEVDDNEVIETLKLEKEDNISKKKKDLNEIITKEESTKEERNTAYEELKTLNIIQNKEEEIELKIKDKYKTKSFIEINGDKVKAVIVKKDHNTNLASEIMDLIQECFDDKMYISIKFTE